MGGGRWGGGEWWNDGMVGSRNWKMENGLARVDSWFHHSNTPLFHSFPDIARLHAGEKNAFVAGGLAGEELDAGAGNGKNVGNEFDEGGVGGAFDGRGAEADFEGVAVHALDGVFGSARNDAQGKDRAGGGVGQEGHGEFRRNIQYSIFNIQ